MSKIFNGTSSQTLKPAYFQPNMKYVSTLEYGINVAVVINVQVGYFCQNNKRTGLIKRTDGNLENKNLTLNRALIVIPVAKYEFFKYKYSHLHIKGHTTAISSKILRFLLTS